MECFQEENQHGRMCYLVEQGVAKGTVEENKRPEIETWFNKCLSSATLSTVTLSHSV